MSSRGRHDICLTDTYTAILRLEKGEHIHEVVNDLNNIYMFEHIRYDV